MSYQSLNSQDTDNTLTWITEIQKRRELSDSEKRTAEKLLTISALQKVKRESRERGFASQEPGEPYEKQS